ncbi:uncharacterized protein PHACADRAFT_208457 [Phanerochaete carnosa HHB-10118-sp]|uniref:Uncharacterized protein n=1 Tax=Phanerochaete carnosa (strain HHB-10118-sp) TaxID=650164 RepID=K5WEA7_PHACS|nr:uncharacterized protein PHACADRAFT_208457 [Phanerochaete carnosa HHB-10118-sp]EKM57384.1 hypothetical protein PHACADRAFT_208457 [Phanerochaete carnosa HHB-10118-sp]
MHQSSNLLRDFRHSHISWMAIRPRYQPGAADISDLSIDQWQPVDFTGVAERANSSSLRSISTRPTASTQGYHDFRLPLLTNFHNVIRQYQLDLMKLSTCAQLSLLTMELKRLWAAQDDLGCAPGVQELLEAGR